ncbi:MAG: GNAT family N-acetyltransferase [Acetobacteraceae bacterium]
MGARILRRLAARGLMRVMSELPHFRTERLSLQRLGIDHLEACLAMDRDPEVVRYVGVRWTDQASHRSFLESRIGHSFPPGMGFWSVWRAAEFVGWIALMPLDLSGPEIEIGWRFVRHAWRRGYATEAARPIIDHALQTLGLPEVVADVLPANAASIRVAEKLGMRPVGPALHNGYHVRRFAIGPAR